MIDKNLHTGETAMEANYESDYITEREKPMPSFNHGVVQSRIVIELGKHYLNNFEIVSEVKLKLPEVKPSVPDISLFPKKEIDLLNDELEKTDPPLTVIEILSPKQSIDDIKNKFFNIYFPGGVKSAWLVIPTLKSVYLFSPDRTYKVFNEGKIFDPVTSIELELKLFLP